MPHLCQYQHIPKGKLWPLGTNYRVLEGTGMVFVATVICKNIKLTIFLSVLR